MTTRQWPAGILRGHSGVCPHRMWRVCSKTPGALQQASNPDYRHLTHAVTMAVHIEQVRTMIFAPYCLLPKPRKALRHVRVGRLVQYFHHGDFVDSVLWMWHKCRSGIAVSIRNNTVVLFVPFCNPDYQNTWSPSAHAQTPQCGLPASRWWANGWTLCGDKVSSQLWSDTGVCALQHMLMTACSEKKLSDCDFIINKRDSAVVRRDGCDALNPLDPYQTPMYRPALVPILSLYTGDQFADIAMPLPSDWQRLTRGTFNAQHPQPPVVLPRLIPWHKKRDCAVFRGSLTGAGNCARTNQRIALLQLHNGTTLDLQGTSMNARWRYCPLQRKIVIPQDIPNVGPWHRIPLHKQQETYRYTVTIDGHSGADRLASLMYGAQCVLKVDAPQHALCPETWASQRMHAWEHYVPVHADLTNLEQRLCWAQHAHSARSRMLEHCKAWSLQERENVLEWWTNITAEMALLYSRDK